MPGLAERLARWVEPEDNPSAAVYGALAIGLLLAAEDPRYESYPKLMVATAVTIGLYWVAHAYARLLGDRFPGSGPAPEAGPPAVLSRLWHEWPLVKGAAAPVVVLVVDWTLGLGVATAVDTAVWTSAGVVVAFELAAGVRRQLPAPALVLNVLVGALLGSAIVGVKLILH